MTKAEALVNKSKKDRFALIISEHDKYFATRHTKEILDIYPCAGILVKQSNPGVAYHVAPKKDVKSILKNGLRPYDDENATFGAGVIYATASRPDFKGLDSLKYAVFEIRYTKGTLASICTVGKEYDTRTEILIKPDQIISFELVK